MLPLIALAFIAVPIIEIVVLIEVGSEIGAWPTIGLLILMAVVGSALLRRQGLATMARIQESLGRNVFPAAALFDGACLLIAGILMLIPGFVSDAVGLLLLVPPVRAGLRLLIWRYLARGEARVWVNGEDVTGRPPPSPGAPTIEGEWREVRPPPDRLPESGRGDTRPGEGEPPDDRPDGDRR